MNAADALHSLGGTAAEILPEILRFEPGAFVEDDGPEAGTWIAVHLGDDAIYLGLIASWPTRRALARALLGLHSTTPIEAHETADAVNELLNLLAGRVKAGMNDRESGIRLGLPFTLAQAAPTTAMQSIVRQDVVVGPVCFGFAAAERPGAAAA